MNLAHSFSGVFLGIFLAASTYAEESAPGPILVTGASSGIGLRITEILSDNGHMVYAGARKEKDLKRLNAMKNVESVRLDVTVQPEIDAAVKTINKKGRGLYGLVNNAGVVLAGPLTEVPIEELEWIFNVNVYGPYRLTQAMAPFIIESQGRIVNISSISGFFSGPLNGHYSMSKHALEAYTDSLAEEMKRFGVLVSAVEPGSFESNAGSSALQRLSEKAYWDENSHYKEELEHMKRNLEQRKRGRDPIDVAQAVMDALFSETPKRRYLVTNANTANITISRGIERILQLNQEQPHSKTSAQIGAIIDSQLKRMAKEVD